MLRAFSIHRIDNWPDVVIAVATIRSKYLNQLLPIAPYAELRDIFFAIWILLYFDMSLRRLGSLVSSYSCLASSISLLYFVRSLYMFSIISGRNPLLSFLKKAPFGVMQYSLGPINFPSRILSTIPSSGFPPPLTKVSGEILYCIIKCGYREFKSNDITQLCIPTSGSFTYAPSYFSTFSAFIFWGMTIFLSLR